MKMIYKYRLLIVLLFPVLFIGCKKFSEIQQNPNYSTIGTAKLLLTGLELDMYHGPNSSASDFSGGSDENAYQYNEPWNYTQRCNQFYVLAFNLYGNQDYTTAWGSGGFFYSSIKNAQRLDVEIAKQGPGDITTSYQAITKFIRSYFYLYMTEQMGDVPLSEAVKVDSAQEYTPKYDTQKSVFLQCFQWMEEANDSLAAVLSRNPTTTVDGDIFFGGVLQQWQKAINSCRLRELINLSTKVDDADLNIKQQFQNIIINPDKYPVMSSNSDNMQMSYNGADITNNYPLWPFTVGQLFSKRNVIASTWINLEDSLHDPRLFVIAAPADSIPDNPADPYARYVGANTGDLQDYIFQQTNAGMYSSFNLNYWLSSAAGVPCVLLGASETDFDIAEAINKGWITGDAEQYYLDGIRQSMAFYGVSQPQIDAFVAAPNILYQGGDIGLTQILIQKYIAFFNNSGWQAYFNYRRTGIPKFSIGPSNQNSEEIPLRFTYPQSEYQNNAVSLQAAINSQFVGSDTRNDVMWLLK